ncbi:hypothetical protein [Azovibrio restrictus]|jgi:hypothetical protein|uniref:hypothetical protein n=1 Tax=Azovibrio restrictus TaxID=146938 RepID=UPI0026EA1F0F|nr:hypothetical protein [Azovibrio restrictus]
MKLSRLSLSLPLATDAGPDGRSRLGPRRVTAAAAVQADPRQALQELLDSVQALAHGPYAGEAHMRATAEALAADLARLGEGAGRLLQPLPPGGPSHPGLDLEA